MDAVELFKNAGYDVSLKIQHRVCLTCFLGLFLAQFTLVSTLVTSLFYEAEKYNVQVPSLSYTYKELDQWPPLVNECCVHTLDYLFISVSVK